MRRAVAWLAATIALGATPARAGPQTVQWAAEARSPVTSLEVPADPLERAAGALCGTQEIRLRAMARDFAARKVRGMPLPEIDEIDFIRRASGEPHPWPRVWVAAGSPLGEAAMGKLDTWLGRQPQRGRRRCGTAAAVDADGRRVIAVVTVDALADLAPLPTRARAGQWLDVEARLTVHARGGKVIVLGPTGAPRPVPTAFDGVTLRARFAPDRPGEFAVQVVADVDGGPRPVIEASVFADAEPPSGPHAGAAPGEDAEDSGATDDGEGLAGMLSSARALAGLRPLARDRHLDAIARAHAARMAAEHDLSHDAGDGDPLDRLRSAGLDARDVGENVAHAPTVALAHRALWASPSHRANVLGTDYDHAGVAVVRDDRREVWAVEVFAGELR